MRVYKCYLHYSDGLNKNLKLSKKEFDETSLVWLHEIETEELVYLRIRIYEEKNES